MTGDVWNAYVLRHLKALLTLFPPLIAEQRARGIAPRAVDGTLEWTLPWGMDDGIGNVRLTLVSAHSRWGEPWRVRVIVSAKAAAFSPTAEAEVSLPRYDPEAPRMGANPSPSGTTVGMADYLLQHTHGDPDSLRDEADGSKSFTVAITLP